uniref:Uncharacterized protein LOC116957947 n=1 Tax=Petromyzon marinus TaxID=7757 RepID=A0AAJ7UK48_PETMA|nr:uncharacterized protein LOC116957947 [Petromyzon marinus]XP_032836297.1 uncharacterized protein LOC116957947 [Petromyzon marinus]
MLMLLLLLLQFCIKFVRFLFSLFVGNICKASHLIPKPPCPNPGTDSLAWTLVLLMIGLMVMTVFIQVMKRRHWKHALLTFEVQNAMLRQQNENLGRRRSKLHEENTTLRAGMEVTRQEFVAMQAETMLQERAMWQHEMLRQGNERLHLENVTLLRKKETLLQEIETLRLATAAATAVTNATPANTDTNAKEITATATATSTAINATNSTAMAKKKKSKFSWFKKHFH